MIHAQQYFRRAVCDGVESDVWNDTRHYHRRPSFADVVDQVQDHTRIRRCIDALYVSIFLA